MVDKQPENEIVDSATLSVHDSVSIHDSVSEALAVSAPHQRALLRLLAVSACHQLNLTPLLVALTLEAPKSCRNDLRYLTELVSTGVEVVDALESVPALLPSSVFLSLRLAKNEEFLEPWFANVLELQSGREFDPFQDEEPFFARAIRMFGLALFALVCLTFFGMKIAPEFSKMMQEFSVEPSASFKLMMWLFGIYSRWWFVPFLLLVATLPLFVPSLLRYLRRWIPSVWQQPVVSAKLNRMRSLALIAQSKTGLLSGLVLLQKRLIAGRTFGRLGKSLSSIESGRDEWQSLADQGLMSRRTANAVSSASSGDTQAWLLRRSAEQNEFRRESRLGWFQRLALVTVHGLIALMIAWVAVAVFSTLLGIMDECLQW